MFMLQEARVYLHISKNRLQFTVPLQLVLSQLPASTSCPLELTCTVVDPGWLLNVNCCHYDALLCVEAAQHVVVAVTSPCHGCPEFPGSL